MKTLMFLLLTMPTVAKDRAWQEGTLTDIQRRSINEVEPFTNRVKEKVTYEYHIQTADRFYVVERQQKYPFELDINARVQFAIEKRVLYVKDRKGKEQKLVVVKQGVPSGEKK